MAAPDSSSILNMTGVWQINRSLSDDITPLFVMQGIPWILRKIINYATVQLSINQGTLPPSTQEAKKLATITTLNVTQVVTPGNFNSHDTYILDAVVRESTVPIFGKISVAAQYVSVQEIGDAVVREKFESKSDSQTSIIETVRSVGNGWETTSIWGFEEVEGKRRHVRYSSTKKGVQELKLRLVYDFVRRIEG